MTVRAVVCLVDKVRTAKKVTHWLEQITTTIIWSLLCMQVGSGDSEGGTVGGKKDRGRDWE